MNASNVYVFGTSAHFQSTACLHHLVVSNCVVLRSPGLCSPLTQRPSCSERYITHSMKYFCFVLPGSHAAGSRNRATKPRAIWHAGGANVGKRQALCQPVRYPSWTGRQEKKTHSAHPENKCKHTSPHRHCLGRLLARWHPRPQRAAM